MATPNSTINSSITVTDVTGALVSNASAVSLIAYFPDGTSTSYSLTSGITNQGNGQYQAKYNTKMAGIIREVWSVVGADGTTLGSAQFDVAVEY